MIERLEAIVARYNEINEELSSPSIVNDIKKMTELSKEQTRLSETVEVYNRYKEVTTGIEEAKELASKCGKYDYVLLTKVKDYEEKSIRLFSSY